MKRATAILALCLAASLLAAAEIPFAQGRRRFALVTGCNDGGARRVRLRYAETDAHAMADLLAELGGVRAGDCIVAATPDPPALRDGFGRLEAMMKEAGLAASEIEVFFYYSGHSDEEGLLLGGKRCAYAELREIITGLPADVRVAILDSCSSGAFTRGKGGTMRPSFLADLSTKLKGYAFLTSASENETAQESDRVGGSFFTHFLISGLRGAADFSHDGRVTLNEAYQFAFRETLATTERTVRGPQHPSYDINLAGSGDLVLTDLRAASATLVIPEKMEGRIFVRDGKGVLAVELRKSAGESVRLALEPGEYGVTLLRGEEIYEIPATVGKGAITGLSLEQAVLLEGEEAVARGLVPPPPPGWVSPKMRRSMLVFGTGLCAGAVGGYLLAVYYDDLAGERQNEYNQLDSQDPPDPPDPPPPNTNDPPTVGEEDAASWGGESERDSLLDDAESFAAQADFYTYLSIGSGIAGAGLLTWWAVAHYRNRGLAAEAPESPPVIITATPRRVRVSFRF